MADPLMEALERARAISSQSPAPAADDLDAALDRARDVAFSAREILPPSVAAQVTPLSTAGLREASTPATDGIPTRDQGLRVADPAAGRNLMEEADTFVRGAVRGIPVAGPLLDRGATALQSRTSGVPTENIQADQRAADTRNPGTALAGEVTGTIVGSVLGIRAAPSAFGLNASTATRAALTGGTTNAVIGALDAIVREAIDKGEVDPRNVATSAALSGAGGALGGVVGRAAGQRVGRATSRDPIENANIDELPGIIARRAQSNYGRAEAAGFSVPSRDFNTFTSRLTTKLTDEAGYAPNLNTTIATALENTRRIASNSNVTLRQLDNVRQQFGNIAGNFNNPAEQRLAGIAIRQLDDLVRAQPDDGANKAITEARRLWHVRSKVNTISNAMSNAEYSPANPLSAVRTAFRPLLRNNAKALTRSGFTRGEIAEVRKLYNASSVDEMLQVVNRAGPSSILTLGVGAVTSFATGSIPTGLGTGVVLAGASRIAGRVTQSRVQGAAENVLRSLARGSTQRPMSVPAGNLAAQMGVTAGNEMSRRLGKK